MPCWDCTGALKRISTASTVATYTGAGSEVLVADALPPIEIEMKAGALGGDSERIQKGLRDLCDCVRECAQRQLDVQRDFEAALRHSIACLSNQVQEDFQAVASTLSNSVKLGGGSGGAGRKGEAYIASKGWSSQQQRLANRTLPVRHLTDGMQAGRLGNAKMGEAAEAERLLGQFSNL